MTASTALWIRKVKVKFTLKQLIMAYEVMDKNYLNYYCKNNLNLRCLYEKIYKPFEIQLK